MKIQWRKISKGLILLSFVLVPFFAAKAILPPRNLCVSETIHRVFGYPLKYNEYNLSVWDGPGTFPRFDTSVIGFRKPEVNYKNLVIDLIFWYLVSCLIISAWDKIKNKKQ